METMTFFLLAICFFLLPAVGPAVIQKSRLDRVVDGALIVYLYSIVFDMPDAVSTAAFVIFVAAVMASLFKLREGV